MVDRGCADLAFLDGTPMPPQPPALSAPMAKAESIVSPPSDPETPHLPLEPGPPTAVIEKWGAALDPGFQVIPDVLLRYQRRLGLGATEVVVLLNITMSWWQRDRMPFPSLATIANRMDVAPRTVQRSVKRLEGLGLLRRVSSGANGITGRRAFDLEPLSEALGQLAAYDKEIRPRRRMRGQPDRQRAAV